MYVIPDPDIIKRIMGLGCDIYTNEETQLLWRVDQDRRQ
jgi:hypothetical protein